jgi:GT2 family glycosyltransferase
VYVTSCRLWVEVDAVVGYVSFPNYIGAGLYRREAFARVGLFDAGLRFAEDSDWYTRAAEAGLAVERLDQVTGAAARGEHDAWQDLP